MENKIKNQHSSELLILNEHRSHSGPDGATSGQENEDLRSKSHHFSSLAEMMLSTNLIKKNIQEVASLILPPEYQQPVVKIPFQF